MAHNVKFGPAGNPPGYNGDTVNVCDYISRRGLDAYEYQATHGVRISKQSAIKLKRNSEKNDILISMHAPYYINLSSNKEEIIDRSIQRLIQSAKAAEWMGAYRIVFHPAFYTKYASDEAMKKLHIAINDLTEKLESMTVSDYTFAPETTGKKSQLGNLDEIIEICQKHEKFTPTIDFAHLHARSDGSIKSKEDYGLIFEKLEDKLGLNSLHSHFSSIEFTDKGERKHHILKDNYGPPLKPLLEEISERGWNTTVICETPLLDEDALLMREIYNHIRKN